MSDLNRESSQWNHFKSTGSVRDYLEFKQVMSDKGANPYAGYDESNRNDFEDGADRGL